MDEKLDTHQTTGTKIGKLTPESLVQEYVDDLHRRADAGELSPATPARFSSALDHFVSFASQPGVSKSYATAGQIDRQFVLKFASHLMGVQISPNGHANTARRRMIGQQFVLNVVRGVYEWARDTERGACLPADFINPFRIATLRPKAPTTLLGEPDVTIAMASSFLQKCDDFQLRLFSPMILLGLRAAEPIMAFTEFVTCDSLEIKCIPSLDYRTKGVRDKFLPLVPKLAQLLGTKTASALLFPRRDVWERNEQPAMAGAKLAEIVREYQSRCSTLTAPTAATRAKLRDQVMDQAGALTYKMIQMEFTRVASSLGWPRSATLKDFRHLFSTCMSNGGVPEHERQFLMGHSPGKATILRYTHLNQLRQHYERAVNEQMLPIINVLADRQQR
jgi:integrase